MVNYYWSKYSVVKNYNIDPNTWPWIYWKEYVVAYSSDDSEYDTLGRTFYREADGRLTCDETSVLRDNIITGIPYYYVMDPSSSMESGSRYYVKKVYRDAGRYGSACDWWECKANTIPYNGNIKGSLIQSNIVADGSAYVNGALNSDGYWYERGAALDTAPTTPGSFSIPSSFEHGDIKTITWGASSDVNSNLKGYKLEVNLNNSGTWTEIAAPTTHQFSYTIPTCTSIQFRVKAYDTSGLQSGYTTSNVIPVTEQMYYWSKYTALLTGGGYTTQLRTTENQNWAGGQLPPTVGGYQVFNISSDGKINLLDWRTVDYVEGSTYFSYYDTNNLKDYLEKITLQGSFSKVVRETYNIVQSSSYYVRGTLVDSNIKAGLNAYTNNNRNSDGYWYVRGARVNQSISPITGFTKPTPQTKFRGGDTADIAFNKSDAANISLYEVDYRYNTDGTWTALDYNNTLTRSLVVTTDKRSKTLEIRVRAKNTSNIYSDYVYSYANQVSNNSIPVLVLTDSNQKNILNNDRINFYTPSGFTFNILANDEDIEDTNLQYSILVNNVEYLDWTTILKNQSTQYNIPKEDILSGGSLVTVKLKDLFGDISEINFTLVNKAPESYSNTHVYEHILELM